MKKKALALSFLFLLWGCAPEQPQLIRKTYPPKVPPTQRPYRVGKKVYYPLPSARGYVEEGIASWYGPGFHGRRTASGERYNMYAFTAAHKLLPMGTKVLVINLENGRRTVVRINDRGPFVKGRIIDLSYAAARALGMHRKGTARVRIIALSEDEGGKILWSKEKFYIQVGAFKSYANAVRLKQKLARRYPLVTIEPYQKDGQTYYRVQVFAAQDLNEARKHLASLEKIFPQAFLVAR